MISACLDSFSIVPMRVWEPKRQHHAFLPYSFELHVTEKYISLNFMTEVFHHFHANGVEFMRALYYSWPQLAWLNEPKQGLVEGIYAGLELLLFAVPRLILSIDFEVCLIWIHCLLVLICWFYSLNSLCNSQEHMSGWNMRQSCESWICPMTSLLMPVSLLGLTFPAHSLRYSSNILPLEVCYLFLIL